MGFLVFFLSVFVLYGSSHVHLLLSTFCGLFLAAVLICQEWEQRLRELNPVRLSFMSQVLVKKLCILSFTEPRLHQGIDHKTFMLSISSQFHYFMFSPARVSTLSQKDFHF